MHSRIRKYVCCWIWTYACRPGNNFLKLKTKTIHLKTFQFLEIETKTIDTKINFQKSCINIKEPTSYRRARTMQPLLGWRMFNSLKVFPPRSSGTDKWVVLHAHTLVTRQYPRAKKTYPMVQQPRLVHGLDKSVDELQIRELVNLIVTIRSCESSVSMIYRSSRWIVTWTFCHGAQHKSYIYICSTHLH